MSRSILRKKPSGVTLIELLTLVAILSVCILPVVVLFNQTIKGNVNAQVMTTMSYLGQYVMETVLARDFFDLLSDLDSAEHFYATDASFDSSPNSPFVNYRYTLRIDAIDPDYSSDLADLAARVSAVSSPGGGRISGSYLRIYVRIDYVGPVLNNKFLELYSIKTPAGDGY